MKVTTTIKIVVDHVDPNDLKVGEQEYEQMLTQSILGELHGQGKVSVQVKAEEDDDESKD